MESYDVAVIGAGLAGLQCARTLARRGLRVALADKKQTPWSTVHTTGIFVRRTLEDFALPLVCLGPPIRDVIVYSPSRKPLALRSRYDEFRVGDMRGLYERMLDECLRLGVTWMPRMRYCGIDAEGARSSVRLQKFRADARNATFILKARYVVGADGAMSAVARDLGLDSNREWIVGLEEVFDGVPVAVPPTLHCFLDPVLAPGYLAWVVHDGVQAHIGVGGDARRFDPQAALAAFHRTITGLVDLAHARLVERRGGRIPVGGVLARIANRRGLLVGDAAGAPSPLTAGGLDACLRLSEHAANAIAFRMQADDDQPLQDYDGARFRARFFARRWMRKALSALRDPLALDIACAALRAWPLRPLAEHIFFGRGSFPEITGRRARGPEAYGLSSRGY
ncbi:MAG TPA: NAD(P)/FAD-dependent oxidoreductase [Candidatus Tumulicola sp.]|nr:NAD(P)/FAD-dependent oxidoreductase [Candidatus Tumulicola sp.]